MDKHETYYPDLITRYLAGEATPEEVSELSEWVRESTDNKLLFKQLHRTWLLMTRQEVTQQMDLKEEWVKLQRKLGNKGTSGPVGQWTSGKEKKWESEKEKKGESGNVGEHKSEKPEPKPWRPEPLIPRNKPAKLSEPTEPKPGPPTPLPFQSKSLKPEPKVSPAPEPEPEPPVVSLEDNRKDWRIYAIRVATIAAIIIVLLIPTWMVVQYVIQDPVQKIMASDEILETTLPDGTNITLSAFSSLVVPDEFGRTSREVSLLGQGYFEVFYDPTLPFVVTIGDARIEAKGTSFYVDAPNPEMDVSVILVEGRVALNFANTMHGGKTMIPGEKAEMIRTSKQIRVTQNDDPNFLSWKTQRIIFFDDPLDKIILTLNRVYQSNITLASDEMATCRMTATFNRQSLESVLNVLEATLDIRSERTNDGIILYGDGCR
jgi:transmembrane sensor